MRQPHFEPLVEIVEPDQATQIRLFDGVRVDDPPQRPQLDRFTDRQRIDNGADRIGQGTHPRLDQLDQTVRHDRITDPLPVAVPVLQMAVGDRLLDDVPQIQDVALRQPPQAPGGVRVDRAVQRGRQQRRRLLQRQRRKVDPLELAELPKLLYRNRNQLVVPDRQQHLRHASLHDLVQNEHRQVVEQVRVVHPHKDVARRRCRRQRVDHPAHQLQAVVADQPRPRRQRTERDAPPARRADHPADLAATGRGTGQGLARDPAFSHARRAADHDAGRIRIGERGLDEPHLLPAPD